MPPRMPPMSSQCAMQQENATSLPLWKIGSVSVTWVFIASVTPRTPWRTISVTTGSTLRVARGLRATVFVLFAMAPLPASRHFDHQMSAGVDFEPVAGQQHGRRGVFLDQRRPAD